MLDDFILDYNTASVSINKRSHYTNLQSTLGYPNLTGSIYIDNHEESDDAISVDEEDITQVYGEIWPKLRIFAAKVNESYVAKFISRQDSGADTEIDIKRFAQEKPEQPAVLLTLENITSKIPNKTNHSFLGWALDPAGTKMVFNYVFNENTHKWELINGSYANSTEVTFNKTTNSIITLYAIFETEKYGIKFYNGNGALLTESGGPVRYISSTGEIDTVTMLLPYGSNIQLPKTIAYKDDSNLAYDKIYRLVGWSTTADGTAIKNLTTRKVTSNLVFYPIFEEDSVYNNVLPAEYLKTSDQPYESDLPGVYSKNENGVLIGIKDGYTVYGKITLPARVNGKKVRGIMSGGATAESDGNGIAWNNLITAIF